MKRLLTGRRLKIVIGTLLVLAVVAALAFRPILRAAGNFLIVSGQPEPSDAIAILSGDTAVRALVGVRLYKEGIAPNVVLTTETNPIYFERLKKDGIILNQTWENNVKVLVGYGVPAERILRVEQSVSNTYDEIAHIRDFAKSRNWKRLVIVSSNYHTRRVRLTARYLLEPAVRVTVVGTGTEDFDPAAWWQKQADSRIFVIEMEKLMAYSLRIWPRLLWR